ncbi:hypothetical protein C8R44DRAFT_887898 [Mycena epipterygia]|nr:hypothetical protein C8R44DRAFT_887898 [Mycena epipterygia]
MSILYATSILSSRHGSSPGPATPPPSTNAASTTTTVSWITTPAVHLATRRTQPTVWRPVRFPACNSREVVLRPHEWLAGRLCLVPSHHTILKGARNVSAANRRTIDACPPCSEHADRDLAVFARQLAVHAEEGSKKLGESQVVLLFYAAASPISDKRH